MDLEYYANIFIIQGEALNAIAHLSDLVIKTKTKNSETGWEISFDHGFNILSKKSIMKNVSSLFR